VQSNNIIKVLESQEAQSYIRRNINADVAALALSNRETTNYNIAECLQLILLYKKARKKLPLFWESLLALDERSYVQCTSEAVALYKTSFLSGSDLLDLTGGLGVDSLFLSKTFKFVTVIERNQDLHRLANFNITRLGIKNLSRVCEDANDFLNKDKKTYSLIYIDPDRRSEFGRSVAIEHLSPNVLELIPLLKLKTKEVYIKLSPLFDIREVYRCFNKVKCIYLIAEKGEIKEVGVWLDFSLVDSAKGIVLKDVATDFEVSLPENYVTSGTKEIVVTKYLQVPLALVAKSSSANFFLKDIASIRHTDFELYYSNMKQVRGFRNFEIVEKTSLAAKNITKMLKKCGVSNCNLVIKGKNQKPSDWHKKLKTNDGGNMYLFLLFGKTKEAVLARFIS